MRYQADIDDIGTRADNPRIARIPTLSLMVERIGVVGLGEVGEGLVDAFVAAGLAVVGVDTDAARRERNEHKALVSPDLDAVRHVDVVVEAVPERLDLKRAVLRGIGAVTPPGTPVVTTSAAMSLRDLTAEGAPPTRSLALRSVLPPAVAPTLDLEAAGSTSPAAVSAAHAAVAVLGKPLVRIGPAERLAAEELVFGLLNRAAGMVEDGYCTPDRIDLALRLGCNQPLGPFALLDHVGVEAVRERLAERWAGTGRASLRPRALLHRRAGDGRATEPPRVPVAAADPEPGAPPVVVGVVGVVGTGVMARGIAQAAAVAGLRVMLAAGRPNGTPARTAIDAVAMTLWQAAERGRMSAHDVAAATARLHSARRTDALAGCDLVVEAVVEDIEAKHRLFAQLGDICAPRTVLATTTSSLSVAACARASGRPGRVVGMHFFNPVPRMRLVEVVGTAATEPSALRTARAVCSLMGKTALDCADRAGFVVNALLVPYLNDAVALAERTALDHAAIDDAVRALFGHPIGPFALMDLIGLDVVLATQRRLHHALPGPDLEPAEALGRLVAAGRLGVKTGSGFVTSR